MSLRNGGLDKAKPIALGPAGSTRQRLGVRDQEMPQRHDELARVASIVASKRGTDIIAQHVAYHLGTVIAGEQVLPKRCGRNLRDVLMLRDCQNLGFVEIAQRDAV